MFNVVRETEALKIQTVNFLIYGEPGIGKTSLGFTANKPILFDFDMGAHRSEFRKDTIRVNDWGKDIQGNIKELSEFLKNYNTVILDTADSLLIKMGLYLAQQDSKLAEPRNKLRFYGALKDEFAKFMTLFSSMGINVVMIAHVKEKEQDGNTIRRPIITGGSYDLVIQKADMVGYMSSKNNRATISFNYDDGTFGKNTGKIPTQDIPDFKKCPDFLEGFIQQTLQKMNSESEAQAEAINTISEFNSKILSATKPDEINDITEQLRTSNLSRSITEQIKVTFKKRIAELGFEQDKVTKQYFAPVNENEESKEAETESVDIAEKVEALKQEISNEIEAPVEEAEFV